MALTDPVGPARAGERDIFIFHLPFSGRLSDDRSAMVGETAVTPMLRPPGAATVRPAVLATVADCLAGVPACLLTLPRLALTLDIAVWLTAPVTADRLAVEARVLKHGSRTIATEVDFTDADTGALAASCFLTFTPSPRPQDVAPPQMGEPRPPGRLDQPLPDLVGVRTIAPGVVEVDHRPIVTQNSGTLQGGIVALLGELAAETLTGHPVVELDTRYLTTVRVGPARTSARRIGERGVRVEVRDAGNGGRLAALVHARVADRPLPAHDASGVAG
ncbi:MAG: hotdog family protein [Acidimicrobiales bacterium]